jgi:hypothetical protein
MKVKKSKMAVVKKSRPKISTKPDARVEIPVGTANWDRIKPDKGWVCCGFDLSLSGVAGCAVSLDKITGEVKGPEFIMYRWSKGTHYFDRITDCSKAHIWVEDLQTKLGVIIEMEDVFIAVEEPWPIGMAKKMETVSLKQLAEISGAFLAGLLRYGYTNLFQIHNTWWRDVVAKELEISNHHTAFNYEANPFQFAPSGKGSGKWRAKEYGLKLGLPDWPDLINSNKHGKIPRPDDSKAKAVQPDDRYDAFPICKWMEQERLRGES